MTGAAIPRIPVAISVVRIVGLLARAIVLVLVVRPAVLGAAGPPVPIGA